MNQIPFIDMHCDTLLQCHFKHINDFYSVPDTMTNGEKMHSAGQGGQVLAVFFPPQTDEFSFNENEFFDQMCDIFYSTLQSHERELSPALNCDDMLRGIDSGTMSAMLSVEDARFLNGSTDKIKYCYDKGVRIMGFTWNFENCLGYPNSDDKNIMSKGLTPFGKKAVEYMNELGIIIDVSHLSDGGFYDIASISKNPFAATHSNCRALCNHKRNLTDDMLRVLAEHGGIAGLNFCPEFLNPDSDDRNVTVNTLTAHVLHMLKVGGEDIIALGTDFDGISGTFEVGSPTQMTLLFDTLETAGLNSRQIEKFAYKNALRLMSDVFK